jgi:D-apionate oxidoisomerase
VVPLMKPGAMMMVLDPAAAHAGELPLRADLSYFVAHPCHPPLINDEVGDARRDFFGGVAKQHIVCALMQGDERDYALGEAMGRILFGPVMNAYRVTVAQMALLEPALVETTLIACLAMMKEAIDEAVKRGVPAEAAREFALGHINVAVGVLFGYSGGVFSDGALLAIEQGKAMLFKPDWKRVFTDESVMAQVKAITKGAG